MITGKEALFYLLKNYTFDTILDVGSGSGKHATVFRTFGKDVTEIDLGSSCYASKNKNLKIIEANYLDYNFKDKFDVVWASHVLEHQVNINLFLRKLHSDLKEGGILAITVPPLKHTIVGGHVSLWNAGLLLYNLILAGFDCSNSKIKTYGYNISVIIEKNTIQLPALTKDYGDLWNLRQFFPKEIFGDNIKKDQFDGDIQELNWDNIYKI